MDFQFSEVQRGLRDSTRSLLAAKYSLASLRNHIDSQADYDTRLWRYGAELGWPALAVPEDDGGLGQGIVELTIVAIEHGRCLLPSPFIPTVVVADAVARSAMENRSEILSALLDGSATAGWAFAERGQPFSWDHLRTRAYEEAQGYVINGAKAHTQDAGSARWLLVDGVLDDQPARFVVEADAPGVQLHRMHALDVGRSYYDVTFDEVHVPRDALCSNRSDPALDVERSSHIAAVLACAEMVGIGERLLEMTVQYAKDRVQFGRPIGSFQAVKHKCADMRLWLQASTATTYHAAMRLDAQTDDHARAVSVAKAYASQAICRLAGEALQIHAGIGFTWEHDLHLYLRRARTNALLYGDVAHHRELLCRSLECTGIGMALSGSRP
jgi:alkylation response protein AidB-like acyl-CoA dehydrogenase